MKKIDDLSYVLDVLQSELKRRFIKYTAPGTANHNPVIYCFAYLLKLCYVSLPHQHQWSTLSQLLGSLPVADVIDYPIET